jgi:hypothetical protein
MISALFSFLGGTAFRMVWGEVSAWLNKKLEHAQEMERLQLSERLEATKYARQQELIRLQHDLGIKEIQIAGDIAADKLAAEAFVEAQKNFKPTGIKWVDAWNASIRPSAATFALLLWVGELINKALVLSEWDRNLIGAILGFYFADRTLKHRGK